MRLQGKIDLDLKKWKVMRGNFTRRRIIYKSS